MTSPRGWQAAAIVLLLIVPPFASPTSAQVALPSPPAVGVSALDISSMLVGLAQGRASALDALAPLAVGAPRVDLPPDLVAFVLDPPPLDVTLVALARADPIHAASAEEAATLSRAHPLPPDVARAISGLGQAVVGALALQRAGEAYEGAALLQGAVATYRGALQRETIILSYREAYSGLAFDEAGTRAKVSAALRARDPETAMAAASIPISPPPLDVAPLSAELALAYARLGLPIDAPTRHALAQADGLAASVRVPLAGALAHVSRAITERDAAYSAMTPGDLAILGRTADVEHALTMPSPTPDDLDLLVRYGEAASRLDRAPLLAAEGDIWSAASILSRQKVPAGIPALADARNDIIYEDPYGLVIVSGTGSSYIGQDEGDRVIQVPVGTPPVALDANATANATLARFDALLTPDPTRGAWPYAESTTRMLFPSATQVPSGLTIRVNPQHEQLLMWDLGGDDVYASNAGGTGTAPLAMLDGAQGVPSAPLPAALLVDMGGNDRYLTADRDTIGSARAGVALLVDAGGDDHFAGRDDAIASARDGGVAILVHGPGNATYDARNDSIAHAQGLGAAVLVDVGGDTTYTAGNSSLAASDLGATASLLDLFGNDRYEGGNASLAVSTGGIATLVDAAGNDSYRAANISRSMGDAEDGTAARVAVLADLGGSDHGACPDGALRNADLGTWRVERAPVHPFEPAFSACVDANGSPAIPTPTDDFRTWIPPTFFASSFANFTLPGLVNVGGLGDDHVAGPFALSVDLLGNDTYDTGALASTNVSRAQSGDLGLVSPVSLLVDTDGDNTFTGANGSAFADGGVAVQALLWSRGTETDAQRSGRAQLLDAPASFANATGAAEAVLTDPTRAPGAVTSAQNESVATENGLFENASDTKISHPFGTNRYLGVARGLGSAQADGVALLISEGYRTIVPDAPAHACRLACSQSGGVAFVVSDGGPGDIINATSGSLGAVHSGPSGGFAFYDHRNGIDTFEGSNESMGVILGDDAALPAAPSVALFVKDGWGLDAYADAMRAPGVALQPRTNDAQWQDAETQDGLVTAQQRAMHVAMGIDDLGWWLDMQQHALDQGTAPGVGPNDPLHVSSILTPDQAALLWGSAFTGAGTIASLGHQYNSTFPSKTGGKDYVNGVSPAELGDRAYGTLQNESASPANSTMGSSDQSGQAPVADPGSGGSLTSPFGLQPVTLARTALSPFVNVSGISPSGDAPRDFQPIRAFRNLTGQIIVRANVGAPLIDADQTAAGAPNSTLKRVELVVKGIDASWTRCKSADITDPLDPTACVVAWWDRDVPNPNNTVYQVGGTTNGLTEWHLVWSTTGGVPGSVVDRLFPSGNYALSVRAFAQRSGGTPMDAFGANDALLDSTFLDATNYTADSYAYFGGAYTMAFLVVNQPFAAPAPDGIIDSNGTHAVELHLRVSEPVTFHATFTDINGSVVRVPDVGEDASEDGWMNVTWHAENLPDARFEVVLAMNATVSGLTSTWPMHPGLRFEKQYVYVDRVAPPSLVDARARSPNVIAAEAPDGLFDLPLLMDPDDATYTLVPQPDGTFVTDSEPGRGSPVVAVHLWAEDDVLDPADPSVVLEHHPWREVANVTSGLRRAFAAGTDAVADEYHVLFPGEARPGPPRVYHVAAFAEDRAGNVRAQAPAGPDCVDGTCAVFQYDITPPRTKLTLVDPAPDLARIRNGTIRLLVDANETPDVASLATYALVVPPARQSAFQALRAGHDLAQTAGSRNVSLGLPYGEPAFPSASGLHVAGSATDLRFNLTDRAGDFDDARPLWLDVNVTGPDGNVTQLDPVNVLDLLDASELRILDNGSTHTLTIHDIVLPSMPGVVTVGLAVDETLTPDVGNASHAFGLLSWQTIANGGAGDTRASWTPDPAMMSDGNALFLIERGVDRAGNVEPKVDYDARVDVDLAPPDLASPPSLAPQATTLDAHVETTEPSTMLANVLDVNGTLASSASDSEPAQDHDLHFDGLAPDHAYALALMLTDRVGNSRNQTPIPFRTTRLVDETIGPVAAIASTAFNWTWTDSNVSVSEIVDDVTLSTDGGTTWRDLTPGGLHVFPAEGATHSVLVDPRALPESPHAVLRLVTRAPSDAANASSVMTPEFVLDGVPPRTTVTATAGVDAWTNGDVILQVNATDGASGVDHVEWSRDDVTFQRVSGATILVHDLGDVFVRAVDKAGNVEAARRYHALIDRDPPTLTLSTTSSTTSALVVPVAIAAEDATSGLARVDVTTDDKASQELTPEAFIGGVAMYLWSPSRAGPHILHAIAFDRAGNAVARDITVLVDREPPQATFTLVSTGPTHAIVRLDLSKPSTVTPRVVSENGEQSLDAPPGVVNDTTFTIPSLLPGRAYDLAVDLVDLAGNRAEVAFPFSTMADSTPPDAPPALRATLHADGAVSLRWDPANDDTGVASYVVKRAGSDGQTVMLASTITDTFFVDTTAPRGAIAGYLVSAVDLGGNEGTAARSDDMLVRAAATFLAASARAEGGDIVVDAALTGPANVSLVWTNGTQLDLPAPRVTTDGSWVTTLRLAGGPTTLASGTSYHLVARDGSFLARWPAADEAALPVVTLHANDARGIPAALRLAPSFGIGGGVAALAAVAILLSRRQRA